MRRILNSWVGTLSHLPDRGKILPGTVCSLLLTLPDTRLKYEPRLKNLTVVLLQQCTPGYLEYGIDAELKGRRLVRFSTAFMPEGQVILRHLKQQHDV